MKKINVLVLSALTAAFLVGCGGGGSSGSSGSSSSSSSSSSAFPSNAVIAEANLPNGQKVEENIDENVVSQYNYLNSVTDSRVNPSSIGTDIAKDVIKRIKNSKLNSYTLNEVINESETCTNGGTISITGNGDEVNGGEVNIIYSNCNDGYGTINGSLYAKTSNLDATADDFKDSSIKFTSDFTVTENTTTTTISKDSEISLNVLSFDSYGVMDTYKATLSIIASNSTEKVGIKDLECYFNETNYEFYYTKGRVYINNLLSYVEIDTTYDMSITPFKMSYSGLLSGEARYNMANGGKGKIVVENNNPITYIDANGDGTYELSENYGS